MHNGDSQDEAERARRRDGRERARQVGAPSIQMRAREREGAFKPMTSRSMEAGQNRYITISLVNVTASLSKQRFVEAVAPERGTRRDPVFGFF